MIVNLEARKCFFLTLNVADALRIQRRLFLLLYLFCGLISEFVVTRGFHCTCCKHIPNFLEDNVYGPWGSNATWFICWFLHYKNCLFVCLFVYLLSFLTVFFPHTLQSRSGLMVTCLTAVCEDPGSNLTAGSCVYHDSHCDIQPCAPAAHP